MKLHLVDAQEKSLTVEVTDREHAEQVFRDSLQADPWVGATLYDNKKRFVDAFVRQEQPQSSHPLITDEMIEAFRSFRKELRTGEKPYSKSLWSVPGLCHEVSEMIQYHYGIARTSGTVMAPDLLTPICLHYWNILPDLSILDMTADQLYEGCDYKIIPPGHPDWFRYQPEFEDVEDIECIRGKGIYSDGLIDFIMEQAARVAPRRKQRISLRHLTIDQADESFAKAIEPHLAEYCQIRLKDNVSCQKAFERDRAAQERAPEL